MQPTLKQKIHDEFHKKIDNYLIELEDWCGYDDNNNDHLSAHQDAKRKFLGLIDMVLERQYDEFKKGIEDLMPETPGEKDIIINVLHIINQ